MADFTMKVGDTLPAITAILSTSAGTAISLVGATVKFIMRLVGASATKVNATATVTNVNTGAVKYSWVTTDTNAAGTYQAEWEITFGDATVETVPNDDFVSIDILDDLN